MHYRPTGAYHVFRNILALSRRVCVIFSKVSQAG